MCFFRKRKAKKLALEQEKQLKVEQQMAVEPAKEEIKPEEPVIIKAEPEVVKEKVEKPAQKVVEKPKVEKKVEPKKEEQPEEVIEDDDPKKDIPSKIPKYHVSQNKDPKSDSFKKWRVRKEGSSKTIKYFDTQKAAIEYADDLAEKAGSSVVIHKLDGSIRKQDYSKKA